MNGLSAWVPSNIWGWIGVIFFVLAILWHKALSGFALILMLSAGFYLYFIRGQDATLS